jgi:hypothetical protein
MPMIAAAEFVIGLAGILIVHFGMIGAIRKRCGRLMAERVVACINVAAAAVLAFALVWQSAPAGVLALLTVLAADLFPEPVIQLTGGPDSICLLRREMAVIFDLLNERPLTVETIAIANAKRSKLARLRTELTARTLDAVDHVFDAHFPEERDHGATLRAYDELDEALAELRGRGRPW